MTDTVNVPRERVEAFLNEWVRRTGNGNLIYGMGMEEGVLELTVSDLRTLLAAAPKAEPVSDPYKLDLESVRSKLSEVVDCSRALRQGGPDPEDLEELSDALDRATSIADDILASVVWSDPSVSVQLLSNTQWLPEAPKVEQEPVVSCRNCGTVRGVTNECDCSLHDGTAPEWDAIHLAPASDELLEAMEAMETIAEEFEHAPDDKDKFGYPIQSPSIYAAWQVVRGFVDKHKGPQS